MHDPRVQPDECPRCGTDWRPGYERRTAKKVLLWILVPFFGGFPIFLAATGGLSTPPQQYAAGPCEPVACDGWVELGQTWTDVALNIGWARGWAFVLVLILLIHFWRGGSISIKGRGLIGRRQRGGG